MMTIRGTLTVHGATAPPAITGIAGLGHIAMTAGLILFFINLGKRISASERATPR